MTSRTNLLQELVLALSDLCRGPTDKKLLWAFHIYDVDGDGVISRTELEDVALSINELTGDSSADPLVTASAVRLLVDRIFQVNSIYFLLSFLSFFLLFSTSSRVRPHIKTVGGLVGRFLAAYFPFSDPSSTN